MIGNTNSCGGGRLNLAVVGGTTAPASPREGTIWVNTAETVTGFIFSPQRSTSAAEGTVYISLGSAASTEISVDRAGTLLIRPTSAQQYVNGTWVAKPAQIYQSGAWVSLELYLYKPGDTNPGLTGGWESRAWSLDGIQTTAPTLVFGADAMTATFPFVPNLYTHSRGAFQTVLDIDLTAVNTLVMRYNITGPLAADSDQTLHSKFMALPRSAETWRSPDAWVEVYNASGVQTATLNVAELSGGYDVAMGIKQAGGNVVVIVYEISGTYLN